MSSKELNQIIILIVKVALLNAYIELKVGVLVEQSYIGKALALKYTKKLSMRLTIV